jgi:hypothetical protein
MLVFGVNVEVYGIYGERHTAHCRHIVITDWRTALGRFPMAKLPYPFCENRSVGTKVALVTQLTRTQPGYVGFLFFAP